eukprot:GSChrysophyteH1.ASY1.ANO1.174.1 assembled CDS
MPQLTIGLFGGGVVGGGVCELIDRCMKNGKFSHLGVTLTVKKICVQNLAKPRDYTVDPAVTTFVTDYDAILKDETINTVVEVMGGTTHAKDVVYAAIRAGKHVVTANKALLSTYLSDIQALLREHRDVQFAYEAAVCGGIPIIQNLQTNFLTDSITSIRGIEAQERGFAEADPTADVEGLDARAKLCLLCKLAFGVDLRVTAIPTEGITSVTVADFELVGTLLDSTIKLVACAHGPNDDVLVAFVAPHVVPRTCSALSQTSGAGNTVIVHSRNMGNIDVIFSGPGAGRYPTANSVLNDLIRVAGDQICAPFPLQLSCMRYEYKSDYMSQFYIRVTLRRDSSVLGEGTSDIDIGKKWDEVIVVSNEYFHECFGVTSEPLEYKGKCDDHGVFVSPCVSKSLIAEFARKLSDSQDLILQVFCMPIIADDRE